MLSEYRLTEHLSNEQSEYVIPEVHSTWSLADTYSGVKKILSFIEPEGSSHVRESATLYRLHSKPVECTIIS
jgi:hypothetical protein